MPGSVARIRGAYPWRVSVALPSHPRDCGSGKLHQGATVVCDLPAGNVAPGVAKASVFRRILLLGPVHWRC